MKIGILLTAMAIAATAGAEDDIHGILKSRPQGVAGTWVIDGRAFVADRHTRLDESRGPLKVGVCVEAEYEDGRLEEIESQPIDQCPPEGAP